MGGISNALIIDYAVATLLMVEYVVGVLAIAQA